MRKGRNMAVDIPLNHLLKYEPYITGGWLSARSEGHDVLHNISLGNAHEFKRKHPLEIFPPSHPLRASTVVRLWFNRQTPENDVSSPPTP